MRKRLIGILLLCGFTSNGYSAGEKKSSVSTREVTYQVNAEGGFNTCGDYTPYFLHSNRQGLTSIYKNNGFLRAGAHLPLQQKRGWDWGAGVDLVGAANHSSPFIVHQLYVEGQWECLDVMIGSKENWGEIRNPLLSSGSLTWSGNARPIPMLKGGIFDFVKIPKLPVEVKLYVSYGFFTDDQEKESRYNFKYSYITTETRYHDKKIYFRSPSQNPFVFSFGAEVSAQFGGRQRFYKDGLLYKDFHPKIRFKDYLRVLVPGAGDESSSGGDQAFVYGNHLGAITMQTAYRFKDQSVVKLYGEGQFEDGSGIKKANGLDGLWGVEWERTNATSHCYLKGFVLEYFQSTNQSGPMLFWPSDYPYLVQGGLSGTQATGADNYYNNFFYDSWSHWGQTAGTPLIVSPLYNKNGDLRILNNRIQAIHFGAMGEIVPSLDYRLLAHWRKGWGTPYVPLVEPNRNFSLLLELNYAPSMFKGWKATAAFSLDRGDMIGNNTGLMLSISKTGSLFKF